MRAARSSRQVVNPEQGAGRRGLHIDLVAEQNLPTGKSPQMVDVGSGVGGQSARPDRIGGDRFSARSGCKRDAGTPGGPELFEQPDPGEALTG